LLLADREPPDREAPLPEAGVLLPPTNIERSDDLRRLVAQHDITQVARRFPTARQDREALIEPQLPRGGRVNSQR
jgi:hypothetical protein